MNVKQIQEALNAKGFGPLTTDGVMGPNTRASVRRFQKANNLMPDGVAGPKTQAALSRGRPPVATNVRNDLPEYPWLTLAFAQLGLHESRDKAKLVEFLKSDGATLGDPEKLPWCGDYVETCIRRALPREKIPENPYLARNWRPPHFGTLVTPQYGCVMSFWRGKKSGISGHVGFNVGETPTTYKILGGNQSNGVTVADLDKERLLAASFPITGVHPENKIVRYSSAGVLSVNEA